MAKLVAAPPKAKELFGGVVIFDNDLALIGAFRENGTDFGHAYARGSGTATPTVNWICVTSATASAWTAPRTAFRTSANRFRWPFCRTRQM